MVKQTDVAIVGAGPYGLSLAAHLRKKNIDFCIFGKPMSTWRTQMPAAMALKSEGFASDLFDPDGEFTLEEYCRINGIDYAHIGLPVKLRTFCDYGLAFQRRFVPNLNENLVLDVAREPSGFRVTLENGETVIARRVVVAAGISHFGQLPPALVNIPPDFVSHSSRYHTMDQFKDKDVVVVGAGSSAIDVAVTLREAGARTQIVTRRLKIPFHSKAPDNRSRLTQLRKPWSGLGIGWKSRLCCDLPLLFHAMPEKFRIRVTRAHLGPGAGWSTKEKIVGHMPIHLGQTLESAEVRDGKVRLQIRDREGAQLELVADHVIAGTGYVVDVTRLKFLSDAMYKQIVTAEKSPVLSSNFESSIPGLYFLGTAAAYSFGPMLRFAFGAGFASRRLTRHFSRTLPVGARSRKAVKEGEWKDSAVEYASDRMAAQ